MDTPHHHPGILLAPIQNNFTLAHPMPASESSQGANISNIERLEQTAERISISSADLGEEIRKIWQEQKRRDSRASTTSNRSSRSSGIANPRRKKSTNHHTHSIVDVNNTARWGGYSPNGFVTSPISPLSLHSSISDPWSRGQAQARRRESRTTDSGPLPCVGSDICAPDFVSQPLLAASEIRGPNPPSPNALMPVKGLGTRDPAETSSEDVITLEEWSQEQTRKQKFVRIQRSRSASENTPVNTGGMVSTGMGSLQTRLADEYMIEDSMIASNGEKIAAAIETGRDAKASSDNLLESEAAWLTERTTNNSRPGESANMCHSQSVDCSPSKSLSYYPAPVPRTLNLPQRLSQQRPSAPLATRQSQLYGSLPAEVRNSTIWAAQFNDQESRRGTEGKPFSPDRDLNRQRQSYLKMQNLPLQLRASLFFSQPSVVHEVEIKNGSAVATLDDFLDASAQAPVETLATRLAAMGNILSPGTGSPVTTTTTGVAKNPTSLLMEQGQSTDQSNEIPATKPKVNCASHNKKSTTSTPPMPSPPECGAAGIDSRTIEFLADDKHLSLDRQGIDDIGCTYLNNLAHVDVAPTTLLAELQLRKEHQRSRTRTAASAFPNGFHASLLELDAVYQMQQKLRQRSRTLLAWEQPIAHGNYVDDDDIPLGRLPTARSPGREVPEQDLPLGLLGQHSLAENEPLAQSRHRLMEQNPTTPPTLAGVIDSRNETLAQRTKRLKESKNIVIKSGHTPNKTVEQAALDEDPILETLAQRRQRLQASRVSSTVQGQMQRYSVQINDHPSSSDNPPSLPTLNHHALNRQSSHPRDSEHQQLQLLLRNTRAQEIRQQQASFQTMRAGLGSGVPLPDFRYMTGNEVDAMRPLTGGFMGGLYNDGAGGAGWRAGRQSLGVQQPGLISPGRERFEH